MHGESRTEGDRTGDRAGSGFRGVRDRRKNCVQPKKPRPDGTAGASLCPRHSRQAEAFIVSTRPRTDSAEVSRAACSSAVRAI